MIPPPPSVVAPSSTVSAPPPAIVGQAVATGSAASAIPMGSRLPPPIPAVEPAVASSWPTFHVAWPPPLPPLLSVEAVMGPRFGQGFTYFPGFPQTTVAGVSGPNITQPTLAGESRGAGAFGGHAQIALKIPALSPKFGVNFEFLGASDASNPQFLDSGTATTLSVASSSDTVPDVLPTRTLGLYASLLGLTLAYRNLAFAALPDASLGANPSANVGMVMYDIRLPIGPVEGLAHLGLGGGGVSGSATGSTKDIVAPQEGKLGLALTLYGVKIEAGVREESLLFASDPGKLFSLFNLSSLTSGSPGQSAGQVASAAQSVARFSYTWGPFVQAGVSF